MPSPQQPLAKEGAVVAIVDINSEQGKQAAAQINAAGRRAQPVLYLVSNATSYVIGAVLVVDDGGTA